MGHVLNPTRQDVERGRGMTPEVVTRLHYHRNLGLIGATCGDIAAESMIGKGLLWLQ